MSASPPRIRLSTWALLQAWAGAKLSLGMYLCFSPLQAVHVAVLTVDEKGTEATRALHLEEKAWSKYQTIMFNRPFLVIIKDDVTNFLLFIGKVVNPTQK